MNKSSVIGLIAILTIIGAACVGSDTPPTRTPVPTETPGGDSTVEVGSITLSPGASGYVPITVKDITDPGGIGAYDFRITFDPAMLEIAKVVGGNPPFGTGELPAGEEPPKYVPVHNVNNPEGWVIIVDFQYLTIPGPTEDSVTTYLLVEAVGDSGESVPLTLEVRSLPNATDGIDMRTTAVNGLVTIR